MHIVNVDRFSFDGLVMYYCFHVMINSDNDVFEVEFHAWTSRLYARMAGLLS